MIERYRKPVVVSGGNEGPHLSTLQDGASRGLISVGGSIHRGTWAANFGLVSEKEEYLHCFSSRGPAMDGLLKPDVVAPIYWLAAVSPLDSRPLMECRVAGNPNLPKGYALIRGTSFSNPATAGALALLISAAKQEKVAYDAERIHLALRASARFLDGYGAHEQGSGVVNVPRAWEQLKKARQPVLITSRGPLRTALPPWTKPVSEGGGLFEREGWSAGQKEVRTLVLRRSSGPDEAVRYHLMWTGNDGTFATSKDITLPRDKDVSLSVDVAPRTPGVHSAILRLSADPDGPAVHQVATTIVAAHHFPAEKGRPLVVTGEAEWASHERCIFRSTREGQLFDSRSLSRTGKCGVAHGV